MYVCTSVKSNNHLYHKIWRMGKNKVFFAKIGLSLKIAFEPAKYSYFVQLLSLNICAKFKIFFFETNIKSKRVNNSPNLCNRSEYFSFHLIFSTNS